MCWTLLHVVSESQIYLRARVGYIVSHFEFHVGTQYCMLAYRQLDFVCVRGDIKIKYADIISMSQTGLSGIGWNEIDMSLHYKIICSEFSVALVPKCVWVSSDSVTSSGYSIAENERIFLW